MTHRHRSPLHFALAGLLGAAGLATMAPAIPARAQTVQQPVSPATFAQNPGLYAKRYLQAAGPGITTKAAMPMAATPSILMPALLASAANGSGPGTTNSYYAMYNQLEDGGNRSTLQNLGYNEPVVAGSSPGFMFFVGGPCSGTSIQTFNGPCLDDNEVAYDLEYALLGFANDEAPGQPHYNAGDVTFVISTNNSLTANNGADFNAAIINQTYQYASYLNGFAAQNGYGVNFYVQAGNDTETPWNGPSVTLPWWQSYNSAAASASTAIAVNDTGATTSQCNAAWCWDSNTDNGWTMHQIYDVNYGYTYDYPAPEIYHKTDSRYYADMDSAAQATGHTVPSYHAILYGCGVGDEASPQSAYADFTNATGKQPGYETDVHAYGNSSTSSPC